MRYTFGAKIYSKSYGLDDGLYTFGKYVENRESYGSKMLKN